MKKYILSLAIALLVVLSLLAACGGGETPAPAPSGPLLVPHPTTGAQENCLLCHETGVGSAPAVPGDHTGRPNNTCTACHKPAGG